MIILLKNNMIENMRTMLFLVCLMIAKHTISQDVNQFDDGGKRHGSWKIYLNSNWEEVNDTAHAAFVRDAHYEHGVDLTATGDRKGLHIEKNSDDKNGAELLNGEYKWLSKKNELKYVDVFENGKYVSHTKYVNGKKAQFADHKVQWRNEPHTFRITLFPRKEGGKEEYYFMRNGTEGWKLYGGSKDGK